MIQTPAAALSTDPRAVALRADFTSKTTRVFIGFALAEGAVLMAAVVAIFVLELIDPETGIWILIGVALLSGLVLSMSIVARQRTFQRELREITGP